MATKKQTGYLVKIEAFVPAHLDQMDELQSLQKAVKVATEAIVSPCTVTITPTRR